MLPPQTPSWSQKWMTSWPHFPEVRLTQTWSCSCLPTASVRRRVRQPGQHQHPQRSVHIQLAVIWCFCSRKYSFKVFLKLLYNWMMFWLQIEPRGPERMTNLIELLGKIASTGMRLKLDKYYLMSSEVQPLGHTFSCHSIQHRVSMPIVMCYSWMFIRWSRSSVSSTFTWSSYRIHPFLWHHCIHFYRSWDPDQWTAFQKGKTQLSSLSFPFDYCDQKEILPVSDASPYGVGAVLLHTCRTALINWLQTPLALSVHVNVATLRLIVKP